MSNQLDFAEERFVEAWRGASRDLNTIEALTQTSTPIAVAAGSVVRASPAGR